MNLTFRQYQKYLIDTCAFECKCSKKEAAYCFPDHVVRERHGQECFKFAQNGGILSKSVLDSLLPLQRHRIFHDLPDYLSFWYKSTGKPYIYPENRKPEDPNMRYLVTLTNRMVRKGKTEAKRKEAKRKKDLQKYLDGKTI